MNSQRKQRQQHDREINYNGLNLISSIILGQVHCTIKASTTHLISDEIDPENTHHNIKAP